MEREGSEMPALEERVDALESRVDRLEVRCGDANREAASAREAHRHNTALLNALRVTQAEHTEILNQHTATLNQHTATLDQHSDMLGKLLVGMDGIQLSIKDLIDRNGAGADGDE